MDLPAADSYGKALTNEMHLLRVVGAKRNTADNVDRFIELKAATTGNANPSYLTVSSVVDKGTNSAPTTYHPEVSSSGASLVLRTKTATGTVNAPDTSTKAVLRTDRIAGDQFNGTELVLTDGQLNLSHVINVDPAAPYLPSGPYTPYAQANRGVAINNVTGISTMNVNNSSKHFYVAHAMTGGNNHVLVVSNESGPLGMFY